MPLQRPRIFMHYPPPHYQGVLKRLCRHWEDEKDAQSRMASRQQVQQASGKDNQRSVPQEGEAASASGGRKGKSDKTGNAVPGATPKGSKDQAAPNVFEHGRDRRDISRAVREKQNRHHTQQHPPHRQQSQAPQHVPGSGAAEKKREKPEKMEKVEKKK